MALLLLVVALFYGHVVPVLGALGWAFRVPGLTLRRLLIAASLVGLFSPLGWDAALAVARLTGLRRMGLWAVQWMMSCGLSAGLVFVLLDGKRRAMPMLCGLLAGCAIGLATNITQVFFCDWYHAPTESMDPTIRVGDYVLVASRPSGGPVGQLLDEAAGARLPERGDILLFAIDFPDTRASGGTVSKLMLKRCIGLSGETLEISSGTVKIDGKELTESYPVFRGMPGGQAPASRYFGPHRVPDDGYFLMGDNRDASLDSRMFGPIPRSALRGRAVGIFWPLSRAGWL